MPRLPLFVVKDQCHAYMNKGEQFNHISFHLKGLEAQILIFLRDSF